MMQLNIADLNVALLPVISVLLPSVYPMEIAATDISSPLHHEAGVQVTLMTCTLSPMYPTLTACISSHSVTHTKTNFTSLLLSIIHSVVTSGLVVWLVSPS